MKLSEPAPESWCSGNVRWNGVAKSPMTAPPHETSTRYRRGTPSDYEHPPKRRSIRARLSVTVRAEWNPSTRFNLAGPFRGRRGVRGSVFARLPGDDRACATTTAVVRRETTFAGARSPGDGDPASQRVAPLGCALRGHPSLRHRGACGGDTGRRSGTGGRWAPRRAGRVQRDRTHRTLPDGEAKTATRLPRRVVSKDDAPRLHTALVAPTRSAGPDGEEPGSAGEE
jgi:hypothetical protein